MPVINSLSVTGLPAAPGGMVTIQVSAQSPEGLALTYTWTVTPVGWTIASGQGTDTVDLTAPATYGTSGSAQVIVSDSEGRTGTGLISLSTEGNFAPIIHSISAYPNPAYRGGQVSIDASVTDPNGDTIAYAWAVPTGFSLKSGQGTASIVIQATAFASGSVTLTADDGAGGSTPAAIGVSVFDGTWDLANLIETENAGDATFPQVAVDSSGNATAVWHQYSGTRHNIWSNRYTFGTGWGTAVLIETNNAGGASSSQVAADPSGNVTAVWMQWDGTRDNVWSNRFTSGSGWGTAKLIETDDADSAQSPQVAFDPSGNATAVWCQSDGTWYNIWANIFK